LHHEIGSHTHVLLEKIYRKKLEQGWLPQEDWEYLSFQIYKAFESISLHAFTIYDRTNTGRARCVPRGLLELAIPEASSDGSGKFRGGCIPHRCLEKRKNVLSATSSANAVDHPKRMQAQTAFKLELANGDLGLNYFTESATRHEPFAMMHRGR
jgi:hypothetical protein